MDSKQLVSRRDLLLGAAATAGVFAVSGRYTSRVDAAPARAGTITVNYWDSYVTQAPWIDREIAIFEKAHKGIKINKTTHTSTEYDNLFSLAVKGGNEPDVFLIPQTVALPDQIAQHWLQPIPKSAEHEFRSRFPKGTFHEGSNVFGGRTYTAPLTGNAPVLFLFINNKVFRQAGLTEKGKVKIPRTWDDMTRAAEAIVKKSGGSTYGFGFGGNPSVFLGFWLDLLVRGAGVYQGLLEIGNIDYKVGKSDYQSKPGMLHGLQQLLDWKNRGYIYPNAMSIGDETARAFFAQGKFGMLGDGWWSAGGWKTNGFTDFSVTTLPAPSGAPAGLYYYQPGGFNFGLSPTASNKEAAYLWMDHLYSVAAGENYVKLGNGLSVFPKANNPHFLPLASDKEYLRLSKLAVPEPSPTLRNPNESHVGIGLAKPNAFDLTAGVFTGQISGRSAIEEALAKLDADNNANIASAIKDAAAKGYSVSQTDYRFPEWNPLKPYNTHLHKG